MSVHNVGETFWNDTQLSIVLSGAEVTGSKHVVDVDGNEKFEVTLETDYVSSEKLLRERLEYYEVVAGDDEDAYELSTDSICKDLEVLFDITHNTVGRSTPDKGMYEKINDTQWKKQDDESLYDEYSDVLFDVTGRDIDYQNAYPSIPGLFKPVVEAIHDSDSHELPSPEAVKQIIRTHLNELREINQSRTAQQKLKIELEKQGVTPRTASRVAKTWTTSS